MSPQPATTEAAGRESAPANVLSGWRLLVARATWVALATLTLGLFVASIPVAYARYGRLCEGVQCDYFQLTPEGAKLLEGWGLSIDFYAAYNVAFDIAQALGFWVIGVILFWRRSAARMVLFASIAFVTWGAQNTLHALADASPAWDLPIALVNFVGEASFFVLFCVFPDGRFVPRWTLGAAVGGITYWLLDAFFPDSSPLSPGTWPLVINVSVFLGLIGSLVVAQTYRYVRVSGPVERQQTKWVVFGLAAAIIALVGVSLIGWIFSPPQVLYELVGVTVTSLSFLLIPLSIAFAVQRHHLWKIDRIIEVSLVYTLLTGVLAIIFELANQLLLPFIFQYIPALDDSPSIKTAVSVVIVFAVLKPSHAWIKKGISKLLGDRRVGRRQNHRRLARRRA